MDTKNQKQLNLKVTYELYKRFRKAAEIAQTTQTNLFNSALHKAVKDIEKGKIGDYVSKSRTEAGAA